jgi:hypothetical protein
MKLSELIFTSLFLLVCLQICFAQETEQQGYLLDQTVDSYCSDYLKQIFDRLAIELDKDPGSTAYIIHNGKNGQEGKNLFYQRFLKSYLVNNRGVDSSRIVFRRGENRDKMIFQYWIVPTGATPPEPEKEFIPEPISSTTLFDKGWADLYKDYDGKLTIYSDSPEPCDFGPNMIGFANALFKNPNAKGYLIIYTQFGKGARRADKVAKLALDELINQYDVPRKTLKTIYGGTRSEPHIELWIVPEGLSLPKLTPAKLKNKEN